MGAYFKLYKSIGVGYLFFRFPRFIATGFFSLPLDLRVAHKHSSFFANMFAKKLWKTNYFSWFNSSSPIHGFCPENILVPFSLSKSLLKVLANTNHSWNSAPRSPSRQFERCLLIRAYGWKFGKHKVVLPFAIKMNGVTSPEKCHFSRPPLPAQRPPFCGANAPSPIPLSPPHV